ncbi:MAG: hypothetical protein MUE53_08800, partial [Chitinophagales bacterium]|nr:hypothetical protein [Chitinophagales bacterium]
MLFFLVYFNYVKKNEIRSSLSQIIALTFEPFAIKAKNETINSAYIDNKRFELALIDYAKIEDLDSFGSNTFLGRTPLYTRFYFVESGKLYEVIPKNYLNGLSDDLKIQIIQTYWFELNNYGIYQNNNLLYQFGEFPFEENLSAPKNKKIKHFKYVLTTVPISEELKVVYSSYYQRQFLKFSILTIVLIFNLFFTLLLLLFRHADFKLLTPKYWRYLMSNTNITTKSIVFIVIIFVLILFSIITLTLVNLRNFINEKTLTQAISQHKVIENDLLSHLESTKKDSLLYHLALNTK